MALNLRPGPNGDSLDTLRRNLREMKMARATFTSATELHGRNYQHLDPEVAEARREADCALRLRAYAALSAFIEEYESALIASLKGE